VPKFDRYVVTVPRVEGFTRAEMRDYILEAVASWGGQFAPSGGYSPEVGEFDGHPLGPPCVLANSGNTKVTMLRRRRRK
jgi:hypothetical protein